MRYLYPAGWFRHPLVDQLTPSPQQVLQLARSGSGLLFRQGKHLGTGTGPGRPDRRSSLWGRTAPCWDGPSTRLLPGLISGRLPTGGFTHRHRDVLLPQTLGQGGDTLSGIVEPLHRTSGPNIQPEFTYVDSSHHFMPSSSSRIIASPLQMGSKTPVSVRSVRLAGGVSYSRPAQPGPTARFAQ